MKNFMNYNFIIKKIYVATYVKVSKENMITVYGNRPFHGLAFMLEDTEICYEFVNGKKLTVYSGEIIYLPKYSSYTARCRIKSKGCYVINFDLLDDITLDPFVFKIKNKQSFLDHFKKAEQLWKVKSYGYMLECMAECYHILYCMQNEYIGGYVDKKKRDLIYPAIEYIHNKYTLEPLKISMLAALCGVSPEYFRKIFRQLFGTSPIKYINYLKITRAKELIASGMYTVVQAAELSGYTDISYFSREFRKIVGCTPTVWSNNQEQPL